METQKHSSVILLDTSILKTRELNEMAARSAENGLSIGRQQGEVEIICLQRLDDEVCRFNRLWEKILSADGIVIVCSVDEDGSLSEEMERFIRLSNRYFSGSKVTRIGALVTSINYCRNDVLSKLQCWSKNNHLQWTLSAHSVKDDNKFIYKDIDLWRNLSYIVGESVAS